MRAAQWLAKGVLPHVLTGLVTCVHAQIEAMQEGNGTRFGVRGSRRTRAWVSRRAGVGAPSNRSELTLSGRRARWRLGNASGAREAVTEAGRRDHREQGVGDSKGAWSAERCDHHPVGPREQRRAATLSVKRECTGASTGAEHSMRRWATMLRKWWTGRARPHRTQSLRRAWRWACASLSASCSRPAATSQVVHLPGDPM